MKLRGYSPDLDPTTPGILKACIATIPTKRGLAGAPSLVYTSLPAAAGAVTGAATIRKLDNSARLFLGSSAKIEEATSATVLTDRSRGGGYTGTNRWRFTQFGDATLATNKAEPIQRSTAAAFADIAGSPDAGIIETVGRFVFAFDTVDGTFGTRPAAWWCSALEDETDWTPSIATQCATGELLSAPGPIVAGKRLADNIIAYKERSMHVGQYAGPPNIWEWREIPGVVGTYSNESVVNIGTHHIFIGFDDIYIFDGVRPISIGGAIKNWFFANLDKGMASKIIGQHDPARSLVRFFYPIQSGSGIDGCIIFNYATKEWGVDDRAIEFAMDYVAAGVTYDSLGTLYSTYDDLPNIAYDNWFQSGREVPAIVDTSHRVGLLTGVANSSFMGFADYGSNEYFTTVTRVTPKFITRPTTAALIHNYRNSLGDGMDTDSGVLMQDGKFDILRSAGWHNDQIVASGDFEMIDVEIDAVKDGDE